MKLRITKYHIQNGDPGRSDTCPIALALKDHYPTTEPRVLPYSASLNDFSEYPTRSYTSSLSKRAMKFIEDFDRKRKVSPLTIILKFPKEFL